MSLIEHQTNQSDYYQWSEIAGLEANKMLEYS